MYRNQRVVGITLAVMAAVAVLATVIALTSLLNVETTVKAIGVGVYWDDASSSEVAAIDWGLVDPGSAESVTVFIRNEGNAAATLSLETGNWNPSIASDYMTLNWDYLGQTLDPESVIEVTFTLTVFPNITGVTNFSYDTVIIGSG